MFDASHDRNSLQQAHVPELNTMLSSISILRMNDQQHCCLDHWSIALLISYWLIIHIPADVHDLFQMVDILDLLSKSIS